MAIVSAFLRKTFIVLLNANAAHSQGVGFVGLGKNILVRFLILGRVRLVAFGLAALYVIGRSFCPSVVSSSLHRATSKLMVAQSIDRSRLFLSHRTHPSSFRALSRWRPVCKYEKETLQEAQALVIRLGYRAPQEAMEGRLGWSESASSSHND